MHFGDQRAGGVEREQIAPRRLLGNRFRHPMRGKDHRRVGVGNFVELLDKDRALGAQAVDHVAVMHDLVTHIDRRPVQRQSAFHRVDRAHHAGAKAARRAQNHVEDGLAAVRRRTVHIDL